MREKVAIVHRQFTTQSKNSASAIELARLFQKLGFEVTVIASKVDASLIKHLNIKALTIWQPPLGDALLNKYFSWRAQQICANNNFKIVVGFGDIIKQNIFVLQNLAPSSVESAVLINGKYNVVLVSSNLMKNEISSKMKIDFKKVQVCYPTFSREIYHTKNKLQNRVQARNKLGLNENDQVVGVNVGSDISASGLDYAFSAIKKYNGTTKHNENANFKNLTILKALVRASPDKQDDIKKLAVESGVADIIKFIDEGVSAETFYHAVDVYFLPARHEPFGRTVLEAMACGLPVLSSNQAGVSEIILSKQLVRKPDDIDGWAEMIGQIFSNKDWALAIARQNAERALALDENQFNKRFLQILAEYKFIESF
jgi:glycosyltransferase involved in cell wall biosynthesis